VKRTETYQLISLLLVPVIFRVALFFFNPYIGVPEEDYYLCTGPERKKLFTLPER
jgi:hypothetical protein